MSNSFDVGDILIPNKISKGGNYMAMNGSIFIRLNSSTDPLIVMIHGFNDTNFEYSLSATYEDAHRHRVYRYIQETISNRKHYEHKKARHREHRLKLAYLTNSLRPFHHRYKKVNSLQELRDYIEECLPICRFPGREDVYKERFERFLKEATEHALLPFCLPFSPHRVLHSPL